MFRLQIMGAALVCSAVVRAQDKACTRQPASGEKSVVVMGHLDTVDPTSDVPTPYLRSVLTSVRDVFRASGALPLVTFTTLTRDTVTYAMTTAVEFEITRDGRIRGAHLIATSLSRALDSIVLGALQRADSAGSLFTLPRAVAEPAHVLLTTYVASDTGKRKPNDDDVAGPLTRITAPFWISFTLPAPMPNTGAPEYPRSALSVGREDDVTAEFVIDASGMVVPSSVYLSRVTYEEFGNSVVKWLSSQARYRPGIVGGCPSMILVRQPFAYSRRH